MEKRKVIIRHAVRYALMTGAAVTAAGYISTASAAKANSPAKLHKVTVTGTRIKRTSIETAQPITRISRQQIEKAGYTNIGTLLGQLSFSGSISKPLNGTETTVNLRGLGASRNLVLVNGKRWFQNLANTTNLDTIPTSLIDHIEVLQDGASAIYGSDALAGVVNIITRKNFMGAEGHAYYSIRNDPETGHWDSQIKLYDFTIGGGNDRGNVVFGASYRKQEGTFRRRRKETLGGYIGLHNHNTNATTPRGRFQLFGPAVSGKTFGEGTCGTYDPAHPGKTLCTLTLINAPAPPSLQNFKNYNQPDDGYDAGANKYLQSPYKDVDLYVQGHYDLFDNVTFSATAAYIRDESVVNGGYDAWWVGKQSSQVPPDGISTGISRTNPYNPFGVDLVADASDPCLAAGTCIGLNYLQRRTTDIGERRNTYNSDNFYISAGFNGYFNLFNREIDWDVGFMQNRLQQSIIHRGTGSTSRLAQALGPAAQCTSPCVPLNLFGGAIVHGAGSITQKQKDFIVSEVHGIYQVNLRDWTANLSSDVYDLPAGPLGVAIGYERLDNYGYDHPDALLVAGDWTDGGGGHPAFDGRVVRDAEYAEINIPLLADRPGAKSLSVDVANRWTQFKRAGGVTGQIPATSFVHNSSGRLNIRYQPIKDLLLRASWSQGFRSPNVNLLFHGQSSSYTHIVDPCAPPPFGSYRGGSLPANCPNGTEDVQSDRSRSTFGGSNPDLKPEKSISRTVGFVYSPSQMPGLDVNADYFKIEIDNAIGTVGVQNIINGCFFNSSFCNLVSVKGNEIITVHNLDTNRGSLLTEGIDVGLHYKFPSTPVGDFAARINGTFVTTFDETDINRTTKTGFAASHLAGTVSHPDKRFNGYLDWDYGNWSAQYSIEYIGDSVEQCTVPVTDYCTYPNRTTSYQGVPGAFPLGLQHLGATVYHDIHAAYTFPSIHTTLALGVNNLFDKKPPISGRGTSFSYGIYRLPSRLIYGSLRVRF
jgi:outer membrane receptor protein involved in Fe transport